MSKHKQSQGDVSQNVN